jgi:hypothetical protein
MNFGGVFMPAKKRTPEIERHVLELRESGMSIAQISKTVKLSVTTIREIFKQASQKSTMTEASPVAEPSLPQPEAEKPNSFGEPQETPDIPDKPEPLVLIPPIVNTRRPGRGRPPLAESGEVKRPTTVAVLPSVYEATRKICYVQRRSISDIINGFLESFVAENLNDLKKY